MPLCIVLVHDTPPAFHIQGLLPLEDEFDFLMTKTFDKSDNDLKYAKCPLPRTVVVS